MKRFLCLVLLTVIFTAQGQTKKELQEKIKFLEEKVKLCELYNSSPIAEVLPFSSDFEFKVLECRGNKIGQTVDIIFTIKHSLPHQKIDFYTGSERPIAYNEMGDAYEFKSVEFPNSQDGWNSTVTFILPTNILVKGKLTFKNVLPQTEKFAFVSGALKFKDRDAEYGEDKEGRFEIRNLKIDWK